MKDYPYGSQSEKKSEDIIIPVKLFDLGSGIIWWLAEYDPETKCAFGYVTGFYYDEWGTVSLEEMEELELEVKIQNLGIIGKTPRIEVDGYFKAKKFPDLPFHKESSY
jgi:hypothetical protein